MLEGFFSGLTFVDCDSLVDCSYGFILSALLQLSARFFEVGFATEAKTGTVGFGVGKVNFVKRGGGVIPLALSHAKQTEQLFSRSGIFTSWHRFCEDFLNERRGLVAAIRMTQREDFE